MDLVFLQEVPLAENWDRVCEEAGFGLATDRDSTYQVRSMLMWRTDTVDGEPFGLPTAAYHGSYLAAARLCLPGVGDTIAVSVHASPAVVKPVYRKQWLETGRPLPVPRP